MTKAIDVFSHKPQIESLIRRENVNELPTISELNIFFLTFILSANALNKSN